MSKGSKSTIKYPWRLFYLGYRNEQVNELVRKRHTVSITIFYTAGLHFHREKWFFLYRNTTPRSQFSAVLRFSFSVSVSGLTADILMFVLLMLSWWCQPLPIWKQWKRWNFKSPLNIHFFVSVWTGWNPPDLSYRRCSILSTSDQILPFNEKILYSLTFYISCIK